MLTTIVFAIVALTAAPQVAPAPSPAIKYCAENMPERGTPFVRKVCKTRAEWIRDYHTDPVEVQRTVKQRKRATVS